MAIPLPAQIDVKPGEPAPDHRQIAQQLRDAMRSGALDHGVRLPPSRELAQTLGVSRNTVVLAYAALMAEGWVETDGRHGTRVRERASTQRKQTAPVGKVPVLMARLSVPNTVAKSPAHLDWRLGQAYSSALPAAVWRHACREAGRHLPPPGYGDAGGDPGLREAIAQWLHSTRSVVVEPDNIVITQGTGQALESLARALLQPGDVCAVENPGYAMANQVFRDHGAALLGVPVDCMGLLPDEAFRRKQTPVLLHVTPAHQYPLGGRLSGERRRRLLELCIQHGSLIIENEYDREFVYEGTHHAPLLAQAPERVVLVSTFAKAISPSLRLGFIVAPIAIAHVLRDLIERERRHVSWPLQISAKWLLQSGELERHLRRVRRHYERMRDLIRQRASALPGHPELVGDSSGLHMMFTLPRASVLARTERALIQRGVVFDRLSDFELEPSGNSGILFGYGHMNTEQIERALALLARCLA